MNRRRFPLIPVISWVLSILAALYVIAHVILVIGDATQISSELQRAGSSVTPFLRLAYVTRVAGAPLLEALGEAVIGWIFAAGLMAMREIEFNTRVAAGLPDEDEDETPATVDAAPVQTDTPKPEAE